MSLMQTTLRLKFAQYKRIMHFLPQYCASDHLADLDSLPDSFAKSPPVQEGTQGWSIETASITLNLAIVRMVDNQPPRPSDTPPV